MREQLNVEQSLLTVFAFSQNSISLHLTSIFVTIICPLDSLFQRYFLGKNLRHLHSVIILRKDTKAVALKYGIKLNLISRFPDYFITSLRKLHVYKKQGLNLI